MSTMSQHDGQVSEEIDGFKYRVLMLDPLTASDILADLGFIMAPVIGSLGGLMASRKSKVDEDGNPVESNVLGDLLDGPDKENADDFGDALERAVIGFFARYGKAKQRELFAQMAKMTSVVMPDGKEPQLSGIFDAHFRGRIKSLYRWFLFAMETQFKDFFTGPGGGMSHVLAQAIAASR